jgi:fatty acid kinase
VNELESARTLTGAALAALERSRGRIDDLNVYPVPDGDTGTNMTLTVRAIAEALEEADALDRKALSRTITRAALLGARGNSGVILSQIVRGGVEALPAGPVNAPAVAAAFRGAADTAYESVREPVEGTMLTVIRVLAEAAERKATPDLPVAELLGRLVQRGEEALERTTEQLEVLREAGVVDAGGAGVVELVRGLAALATGEPLPEPPLREELAAEAVHQELSRYRYCTMFMIEGDELDRGLLEDELERLGDSLLVVGDSRAVKVHVHTDDPDAALAKGRAAGTVEGVEIADMHRQTVERRERLPGGVATATQVSEVVAVVAGDGNRLLFESLGATGMVDGGRTMNPSTAELLAAIEAAGTEEVVLLPNNPNVLMSADRAAEFADKHVEVVASDSLQAGLSALVAFDGGRGATDNSVEMREALEGVATGALTVASREVEVEGGTVRTGEYLGLVDGRPVSGGAKLTTVAEAVAERLLAEPREILTLLTGEEEPSLEDLLAMLRERYPALEIEVHAGGQPHYLLLLSAE